MEDSVDIASWLRRHGLQRYEQAFRENNIDSYVLGKLTAEDLKDLGVVLVGDRRRLLDAIEALRTEDVKSETVAAPVRGLVQQTRTGSADAERRQVTVLFSDLVGSTALSARLDPEDLGEIIGAYRRRCAEVIAKSGGFVARYVGDGILAYFGYPQAHEEDAERAVRAGLALVEAVAELDGCGTALRSRIGIATGLVVVGGLSKGAVQEHDVVGETPNLAARLQTLAEPTTVIIDATTRRLLGGLFEYRALGPVSVKGFGDPVPVWQVIRASAVENRFEALRAANTPLVGRDDEIDLLMRRWQQAKRGDGCVVLISGEPGIGKSRIAQTLLERLSSEPLTRLRYFCSPHHQDSALYPVIRQLERAAGFRREDSVDQRLNKLEAALGQAINDLTEAVPLAAALLSIPMGDRYPRLSLSPQKQKERTLRLLSAQIEGLAARQPILMVIEDAHWSDPTSRESFDLIIDQLPSLPILGIVTFRPEFTAPWVGRPHVTLISLNRLPPRRRVEVISGIAGGKPLPVGIVNQIIDRTDGVPLFIEELTKAVIESGALIDSGDRYTLTAPLPPLAIPTSLNASLLARLDRLATAREVAQIGAALGRQFSHELISAVASIPQQQLDDALTQLVNTELIYRRGTPPDAEYTFKHALVQDAAYGAMLRSRRQQLHGQIATALEHQFPETAESQPEILARHCTEAGFVERATAYWLKAGQQAFARGAMTEAAAQFRKGIDLVSRLPEGVKRWRHELDLRRTLATALMGTRGFAAPAVAENLARARQLGEQLGQPSHATLVGQWVLHKNRGQLAQACELSKQIVDLGESLNDRDFKFQGCVLRTLSWFQLGDFVAARDYAEEALALYDPAHRSLALWGEDPQSLTLAFSFRSLLYLGYLDQARSRRDKTLQQVRQFGRAQTLAMLLAVALHCDALLRTDPATLLRQAEELAALCAHHDFAFYAALAALWRGWCLSALGHTEEGLPVLTEAVVKYQDTGVVSDTPSHLIWLADALAKAGREADGLKQLDKATVLIETTQERWSESDLHRVRGRLLSAIGDRMAAEESFLRAIAVARRQNAKLAEVWAAISLARFWRDQAKLAEACGILAPVYSWFSEGFDTPLLHEAKVLLESMQ
jgi:class 3 adenylate cyclase/tetratricopeptide (TPR) repeat protein